MHIIGHVKLTCQPYSAATKSILCPYDLASLLSRDVMFLIRYVRGLHKILRKDLKITITSELIYIYMSKRSDIWPSQLQTMQGCR